jgi:hypothetical protein
MSVIRREAGKHRTIISFYNKDRVLICSILKACAGPTTSKPNHIPLKIDGAHCVCIVNNGQVRSAMSHIRDSMPELYRAIDGIGCPRWRPSICFIVFSLAAERRLNISLYNI